MNITKDQTKHLTPEQEEALGSIVIDRDKMKQLLLKQRRGHHQIMSRLAGLLIVPLIIGQLFFTNPMYLQTFTTCAIFCLWIFIQIQMDGVNQRLDALIELMENDPLPKPVAKPN